MGMASLISKIWLLFVCFQNKKFSFRPWTIDSPWGQKIESAQKIHASGGCCEMHANQFGVCGLSGFGDLAPFCLPSKMAKVSFSDHGLYSPWGQKIESAQKIHASRG